MKSPSMAAKKPPQRDAAVVVDEVRVLSSLFTVQATIIPAEFSSIRDSWITWNEHEQRQCSRREQRMSMKENPLPVSNALTPCMYSHLSISLLNWVQNMPIYSTRKNEQNILSPFFLTPSPAYKHEHLGTFAPYKYMRQPFGILFFYYIDTHRFQHRYSHNSKIRKKKKTAENKINCLQNADNVHQ